jgi:hypothetical protein
MPASRLAILSRPAAREAVIVALASVALAIAWTWPLAVRPATTMAAPFGDPLLNAWILGWGADRLAHGFAGLWSAPFFYPYPDTLAFSEHLLGIAIPLAPIYWLTGNAVLVYNVALIASFALAGGGMYLLARDLTGRRDAAILAGLAFMWCPYRAPQVTHLQVLMNGWMPIALWALHRYFATGSRRALAGFVAAFVLQGLSNGYFLFFLAVPVVVVSIVELLRRRDRLPANLLQLSLAALAIGVLIAPVAAAYLRVKREQGLVRARSDAITFGATLADYAAVSHQPRLWSQALPTGAPEKELFPGLAIVLLAFCVLLPAGAAPPGDPEPRLLPPRTGAWLYAGIGVLAIALSMGPEPLLWAGMRLSTGPYDWLGLVLPGFAGLRAAARFATVAHLALAVLGAYGAARLLGRLPRPAAHGLVAALGALIVAEGYIGPLPLERVPSASMGVDRAAYEWLGTLPRGAMLELPIGEPDPGVRYLYRTLLHGQPIVNGYSGYGSALQDFLGGPPFTEIDSVPHAVALSASIGVRYLVVHGQLYADPAFGRRLAATIREQAALVARERTFGSVAVFELRPARAASPLPSGTPIAPATLRLSASHNTNALGAIVDGQTPTRWLSGVAQDGSEWIRIDFDRPRRPSFLRLAMDRRSFGDYPRRLVVEASRDGSTFTPVFDDAVVGPLGRSLTVLPVRPRIDVALPGGEALALRLRQTGQTPRRWYWSVHELELWESNEAPSSTWPPPATP